MKKKFRLIDAILMVICVVFVAEAAAPVAAIGNSQYFWWLFMMVGFLVPYGLISSELGTTYDNGGGLYDWVRAAYPNGKMAGRVSWYYWINFPLWTASLAVMIPELITVITGYEFNTLFAIILELAFVWIVAAIASTPTADATWILNGAAVIKVGLAVLVGILGIYGAVTNGLANPITAGSLLPSFDLDSLSYISVIIFNMLGFEVICTMSDNMEDPKREIPKAIVVGGLVIAAVYMFSAFGIGAAIPTSEISTDSGLLDAFQLLTGKTDGLFISAMALLFMLTLFANMISWSTGVHEAAAQGADNGDMPAIFGKRSAKNDMPTGGVLMTAIVASVVVIIAPFIPNEDMFWSFFALNLVMFLMSYLPIFPGFLKLRKVDPDTERPYRVPGGPAMLKVLAYVPFVLIIISIIFTAIPLSFDAETLSATLPITIGAIIFIILGEIIIRVNKKK